ncbi:MAG: YeeE/YedE family protein [Deltaproteobacteria bacterium]|nr:YeeE/YedE family protein [Deltaproteobacteria bacterium]
MSEAVKDINWKGYSIISILLIIGITLVAIYTKLWVLTAIPVGFLFGFFLKKGELCGASAMSEIPLMRDKSKAFGLWIAIVVSMVLFAAFDLMGMIKLSPKPLIYLNYIVGGVLFGIGIVLAGGCVSGCLFKSAAGNINSMVGLIGIPLGIALVEYGYLSGFQKSMQSFVIKSQDGGPVTLSSLTGMPYWMLAAIFAVATIIWIIAGRKKNKKQNIKQDDTEVIFRTIRRPWKPWKAGIAIGVLAIFAYLSSASTGRNYPLGVTHGVLHMQMLFTENNITYVYKKPEIKSPSSIQQAPVAAQASTGEKPVTPPAPAPKKINLWLLLLVVSLMIGSWVSGRLSGTIEFIPRHPSQTVIAFIGGIMLGAGAAFAGGCVIGNILSGWALMSVGNILFGVVTILTNWATTYFYLMGGKVSDFIFNE